MLQHYFNPAMYEPNDEDVEQGVHSDDRVEFVEMENGVSQLVAATQEFKFSKGFVPKPKKAVSLDEMRKAIKSRRRT